jgi:hypothetical protein
VAFAKAPGGKPAAFYCAVLLNGLFRVLAAAWVKAAVIAQPGAEQQSIQLDQGQK